MNELETFRKSVQANRIRVFGNVLAKYCARDIHIPKLTDEPWEFEVKIENGINKIIRIEITVRDDD